jgi:CheY-like chemotaxis protein
MEQTILQIQDYLTENEVELALNKLRSIFSISNSELVNDAILLAGQFKKLQSDVRKGIIDYSQENLRHNKIMDAILSLIDEIKQAPEKYSEFGKAENQLDQSVREKGKAELPTGIKDALFERIAYIKEKKLRINALWVDDIPSNNQYESKVLSTLGLVIDFAQTSDEAGQMISSKKYELVLSNISRNDVDEEGLLFHKKLLCKGIDIPMIFYIGHVDRNRGVPAFAFGIADMPNDLIHLVLDVIERKY